MVIMFPTRGYKKPAPTEALTSRIGSTKSLGAPFLEASWVKEYCVLAMQIGSFPNPMRVYFSICASASGRYSTPEAA